MPTGIPEAVYRNNIIDVVFFLTSFFFSHWYSNNTFATTMFTLGNSFLFNV